MVEMAHYGHIPDELRVGHEPRQKLIAVMGWQRGSFQHLQLFLLYGCNDGHLYITFKDGLSAPKKLLFLPTVRSYLTACMGGLQTQNNYRAVAVNRPRSSPHSSSGLASFLMLPIFAELQTSSACASSSMTSVSVSAP